MSIVMISKSSVEFKNLLSGHAKKKSIVLVFVAMDIQYISLIW